jgi:biopolymer transport protein ExbD
MAGGTLGGGSNGRRRMITEINVTPLVDIMLVLLIIFMVTATYIVRESLEVKLPEASTGAPKKVTQLAVTIASDGKMALNGQPVSEAEVRKFIRERKKKGVKLEAVIAADKAVAHGNVVRVIDLVRQEGVLTFAINVLKPQK